MYCTEPYFTCDNTHRALYQWLRIIYDPVFEQYDNIAFFDTDIIPCTDENVFDQHDGDVTIVCESVRGQGSGTNLSPWDADSNLFQMIMHKFAMNDMPVVASETTRMINYNSGMVIWSRGARLKARKLFDDWQQFIDDNDPPWLNGDQMWLTGQLLKYNFDVNEIDEQWNGPMLRMPINRTHKYKLKHYQGDEGKLDIIRLYDEERNIPIHGGEPQR